MTAEPPSSKAIQAAGVIVAAGSGRRMGSGTDKLFLTLQGEPVLSHAWRRIDAVPTIREIVVVARPDQVAQIEALGNRYAVKKAFRVVVGGAERQDSVWNGLEALSSEVEIVAIHDAARPLIDLNVIDRVIERAGEMGAAVVAEQVTDTIKESLDGKQVSRHLDRSRLWAVQTPQAFRVSVICEALRQVREKALHVTDDTAACDLIGQPVELIENDRPNPKLTRPSDLDYLEWILSRDDGS